MQKAHFKCQIAKKANYYQKTHGRSIDNKDAQANAKDLPEQFQKQKIPWLH